MVTVLMVSSSQVNGGALAMFYWRNKHLDSGQNSCCSLTAIKH